MTLGANSGLLAQPVPTLLVDQYILDCRQPLASHVLPDRLGHRRATDRRVVVQEQRAVPGFVAERIEKRSQWRRRASNEHVRIAALQGRKFLGGKRASSQVLSYVWPAGLRG